MALNLGFFDGLGDLAGDAQGLGERQAAGAHPGKQRLTTHILHYAEQRAVIFGNPEDLCG